MRIAPLTIAPVSDMRYAGQLLDYVRIKYRRKVRFSGLPILLQLKTTDWQQFLENLQQAFDQQHGISAGLGTLPEMGDWSAYLSKRKQCHLLVLRLLAPNSVEILCKLIQWVTTEKKLPTPVYVIVAADKQLLENVLIKQAVQVASAKVDIYTHDGTHDDFKRKSAGGLWLIAALLAMAVIGGWLWFGQPEWLGSDKTHTNTIASIPVEDAPLESDLGLPDDTASTESWDYRVESEWFKQLPAIELPQQQDDGDIVIQPSENTADSVGINIEPQATGVDQSTVEKNDTDDQKLLAGAFRDALESNDLQWLRANTQTLLQWHAADGQPALMILTGGNHIEWVNTLLEQGAQPDVANLRHWTPLIVSAVDGYFEIAQALLIAGADPNRVTNENRSALMAAVHNRHPNIAELLLQHGANVNQQSNDGWSPLFYAAWNQDVTLVKILLAADARQDLVSATGMHVIDIAKQRNNQQVIDLLDS